MGMVVHRMRVLVMAFLKMVLSEVHITEALEFVFDYNHCMMMQLVPLFYQSYVMLCQMMSYQLILCGYSVAKYFVCCKESRSNHA